MEQLITSKKCQQQQEENIQDINETNQSKTQNNLLNSPILSRNNSPYSSQLSQHTILHPSPLISTNEEINLTGTITNSQTNALKLIVTENLIDDPLKIRPSATLMKSDYLKLEIAITALLPYLPKFQIRKSNNSRNTNEQEIQVGNVCFSTVYIYNMYYIKHSYGISKTVVSVVMEQNS